jgi:hypothetical protein
MELVDRYVHAVKRHLPAAQQDDIVNELTDDILSQIKDKEAELGRPLDLSEQEAILKHYGHPLLLAMRYLPQQHLIGPATFPYYWPALKIALAITFGVHVMIAVAVSFSQNAPERVLNRIFGFPRVALLTFAWVTLVFAALDFFQAKLGVFDNWTPRSLPPVSHRSVPVNRKELLGEIAGGLIFLVWWLAIPRYPFLMLGPGTSVLMPSPAFHRVHLVAILPHVTAMAVALIVLLRPSWTWLAKVRPLYVHGMTLVAVSILLKAGHLLTPATDAPGVVRLADLVNQLVVLALLIVSIIAVIHAMSAVIRLARTYRG